MKEKLTQLLQGNTVKLHPSQDKICVPVVERIYRKMKLNLLFSAISVADGLIIEGHHRYVASLLSDYDLDQVPGVKSSAKIPHEWKSVELVEEDWDTPAKIDFLNEQDAKYNGLSLDDLIGKMAELS